MSITVDLKSQVELHLITQAAAKNMSVEDYVEAILETLTASTEYESLSQEQRSRELDQWLNSHDYVFEGSAF